MEKIFSGSKINGFVMLLIMASIIGACAYGCWLDESFVPYVIPIIALTLVSSMGFVMIEPNDMRIMLFFGKYKGTMRNNGFFWVNPFMEKIKLTQRARNLDVEPIKVNDKGGNPVMIGLVLVWKIKDSYKATFDIDSVDTTSQNGRMASFQRFVSIQSDSALRNIASEYSYDNNETTDEVTLRSGGEQINDRLEHELNSRLSIAGIEVMEARINYLAYAPEIAAVMLRRQQASAIISAREKIVEGAVSMVKMALEKLEVDGVIDLDEEKKAAMVSNLLVVLCSDGQAQPVINTGTLHQ